MEFLYDNNISAIFGPGTSILDSAEKKGYLIIVLKSNESYDLEKKLIEKLLKQNVDGVFISLAQDTYDLKHLEAVKKAGVVLIQYDKISKILESSKVVVDDRNSGYLATEHLIKNGCRNIVHFRGPLLPQVSIDLFEVNQTHWRITTLFLIQKKFLF